MTDDSYFYKYGDQLICEFQHNPIGFEYGTDGSINYTRIDGNSDKIFKNYVLRLRSLSDNRVIVQQNLKRDQESKVLYKGMPIIVYSSQGRIDLNTIYLDKFDTFSCCMENTKIEQIDEDDSYQNKCSYVRFDASAIRDHLRNNNSSDLFKYNQIVFLVLTLLSFSLIIIATFLSIKCRNTPKKTDHQVTIGCATPSYDLYAITSPLSERNTDSQQKVVDDTLYARYNITSSPIKKNSSNTFRIDCLNDTFPPTYDEFTCNEINNQDHIKY